MYLYAKFCIDQYSSFLDENAVRLEPLDCCNLRLKALPVVVHVQLYYRPQLFKGWIMLSTG